MIQKSVWLSMTAILLLVFQVDSTPVFGQLDDFEDNTSQGWGVGQPNSTAVITTSVEDMGPNGVGDSALEVEFRTTRAAI